MSKEKSIVPELRFPEFEKDGEWSSKKLGDVAAFSKGKGIGKADIAANGITPCIRYGELYTQYNETIDEVTSSTNIEKDDLVLSQANDVIIPASGETRIDIATASCVLNAGVALGSDLNIIRSKLNGVFLAYYLNNGKKMQIAKMAQGVSVIHLYSSQLKSLGVDIPKPKEQQKIADCLSSLDALIAAHRDKLDALREHKKGLMQNLFPQEGETVPRYRFAGFEGAWEERTLGDFIKERNKVSDTDTPLFSLTIEDGVTPKSERYERSFLVKSKKEAYKSVYPNDFAYNPMNLRFGAIAQHKGKKKVALSKYYNIFSCDSSVDSLFCDFYFRSNQMIRIYDDIATGSLIEKRRVHFSEFIKLKILFPKKLEQQKIADCLSAVDELITAQEDRIAQLQEHKRGLMQGLFPKTNG